MANVTFLCPQIPHSPCSVHGLRNPSWCFPRHKPASHMEQGASPCACISPKLQHLQLQAPELGLTEGCLGNGDFPSPPVSSPGNVLTATRNPHHSGQVVVDLPAVNRGTYNFTVQGLSVYLSI